ncbi:A24 family peptidase [Thermincola potens]|uniref:Peptidase A24A prepilin type IV n=1 Tax=Thermincola potens (strain JR) TaxID=635013 RepID=D5XCX0_THEPJ|nr:prepilin peptidase [Thermincola potens]ADG83646.1 peptidase A24A prepilin type IV [Thermincola potens JR]
MFFKYFAVNDLILVLLLTVCLYTDLKERKIYNKFVFPAIVFGLLYFTYIKGGSGLIFSLKGFGLGIALLFIPFALGGFGAGDVKLLGAVGALKGPAFVFAAFVLTALAGGLIALGFLICQGRFFITLKRIVISLYILVGTRFKINSLNSLEKAEYHRAFPYGIAIVAGTVAAYWVR